jgi:hypothetical protein
LASAGAGFEKTGERKSGNGKRGKGVDSVGTGTRGEVFEDVDGGKRVSRWVISAANAGPRASRDGSYIPCKTGLLECMDKASSKALRISFAHYHRLDSLIYSP